MEAAIKAINKWIYFGWNYPCIEHEWIDVHGDKRFGVVPQFLVEVKWTCNFEHMLSKWKAATHDTVSSAYLVKFYAELDTTNSKLLLEWVMENYNDEQKIFSKESEDTAGNFSGNFSEAQTLEKIREWAENVPYYLSNREGYARGYRDAMIRSHKTVMSMITGVPFEE